MKDLQAIIDNRAETKLKNDLKGNGIFNFLDHVNLGQFKNLFPKERKVDDWTMASILANGNSTGQEIRTFLFGKLIDDYKEREAKAFIQEVDALKSQLSSLSDEVNSLQYNS